MNVIEAFVLGVLGSYHKYIFTAWRHAATSDLLEDKKCMQYTVTKIRYLFLETWELTQLILKPKPGLGNLWPAGQMQLAMVWSGLGNLAQMLPIPSCCRACCSAVCVITFAAEGLRIGSKIKCRQRATFRGGGVRLEACSKGPGCNGWSASAKVCQPFT